MKSKEMKQMKVDAQIFISRCGSTGKLFATRVERRGGEWVRTWAFPISEEVAKSEGFDQVKLSGNFPCDDDFKGCPYCGNIGFVHCGACEKITCYDGRAEIFTCQWCKNSGNLTMVESMDLSGGDY
jgi:hypothetical protein